MMKILNDKGKTTKIPISTAVVRRVLGIFHASSVPLTAREASGRVEMDAATMSLVLADMRKHGLIDRVCAGDQWIYFIASKKHRKNLVRGEKS